MSVPIGGIAQGRADISLRQFGDILQDFAIAHTGREPAKNIGDRNARAADGRPPAADVGIESDMTIGRLTHCFQDPFPSQAA